MSLLTTLKTPALLVAIAPFQRISLWIAPSIAKADAIVVYGAKTLLAKKTTILINGHENMPNKAPRYPPV